MQKRFGNSRDKNLLVGQKKKNSILFLENPDNSGCATKCIVDTVHLWLRPNYSVEKFLIADADAAS